MTSNKIYSNSARQYWQTWLVALVWNAMVGFTIIKGGHNILSAFAENPIFYFFVLFPFIGLWIIIDAIRQTLAWHKFGKTPIVINPSPGQIGGSCAGYIILPLSAHQAKQAEISLSCMRRYISSKNNGKRHHHSKLIWQDRLTLKPERYGKKIRLNFAFTPPYELPKTEQKSDDYHVWHIQIRIPLPGIDFERSFEVPMEKAAEQAPTTQNHFKTQSSPLINHQDAKLGSIPLISKTTTGSQFYYGYGRSKGMAIALLFFGLFIGVFGYFFLGGFVDFLPATTSLMAVSVGLIALSLLLLGLFLITHSLTVEVSLRGIRKKQRIFAYSLEETVEASNIVDIISQQNASYTSGNATRAWYCLKLLTHDNRKIEVGDSLESQNDADEIKRQMLTALGTTWQPATLEKTTKKAKKPLPAWVRWISKISSYAFLIAFLYDINIMFPEITVFISQFMP